MFRIPWDKIDMVIIGSNLAATFSCGSWYFMRFIRKGSRFVMHDIEPDLKENCRK